MCLCFSPSIFLSNLSNLLKIKCLFQHFQFQYKINRVHYSFLSFFLFFLSFPFFLSFSFFSSFLPFFLPSFLHTHTHTHIYIEYIDIQIYIYTVHPLSHSQKSGFHYPYNYIFHQIFFCVQPIFQCSCYILFCGDVFFTTIGLGSYHCSHFCMDTPSSSMCFEPLFQAVLTSASAPSTLWLRFNTVSQTALLHVACFSLLGL